MHRCQLPDLGKKHGPVTALLPMKEAHFGDSQYFKPMQDSETTINSVNLIFSAKTTMNTSFPTWKM